MHKGLDYSAKRCTIVSMDRIQLPLIEKDLRQKLVFLTGPRQVGKTHLALALLKKSANGVYLNYDNLEDRAIITTAAWLPSTELLVLDELHKMAEWKNFLKGIFDTRQPHLKILVTGSARLDTFRSTGDSLAGRYFRHRLNPLSVAEIPDASESTIDMLMTRGGFPEPFLAATDQDAARWRLQYVDGLIRTDILDFERIHDLRAMQLTLELLRRRVGSPISITSLAQDVACSPNTIKKYLEILEALFIVFRVTPFHHNIARSLLKEPKLYFYDTGMVKGDDGLRFENLMAVSLLKHVNAIEDYEGKRAALHYLRTKEKKEVDFAVAVEDQPTTIIEAKLSDSEVSPSLRYFHEKYDLSAMQVVRHLRQERMAGKIAIRRALGFLRELKM
ncbi:MAG: ATP-binding protein [Desulfurivibrionaceae bacterium]